MKEAASPGHKPATVKMSGPSHPDPAPSGGLEPAAPATPAVPEPAYSPGTAASRRVRFGYFKPEARAVHLVGSFNGWQPGATPMRRDGLGDWSVDLEQPRGEHRYRFVVDGEWRDDPAASKRRVIFLEASMRSWSSFRTLSDPSKTRRHHETIPRSGPRSYRPAPGGL